MPIFENDDQYFFTISTNTNSEDKTSVKESSHLSATPSPSSTLLMIAFCSLLLLVKYNSSTMRERRHYSTTTGSRTLFILFLRSFLHLLLLFLPLQQQHVCFGAPSTQRIRINGNIMLGALMMVHERENETLVCGDVMPQGGIQATEAMLYTLDHVNRMQIIPKLRLGAEILDDCDKDTYGLKQAVNFIKGSVSSLGSGYVCRYKGDTDEHGKQDGDVVQQTVITGVIAASSSVTSIQVANLLKLFQIPQISYFSTSMELSNQERFPYFFRTIPSDSYQTRAMRDIVVQFNWTYISVIYEESNYGKMALNELEQYFEEKGICIAVKERLPKDSDVARHSAYVKIVNKLKAKSNARGVIIYGSDQEVHGLMRAVKSQNATGLFTWIGSDGWSSRELVYRDGHVEQALGTISVQPKALPISGFKKYFNDLRVETNGRNPWFWEFWEHEFGCKYPGHPATPYNANYRTTCTGKESEKPNHQYTYESQLQFVSDAVMAFAFAIRNAILKECSAADEFCIKCYTGQLSTSGMCSDRRLTGEVLREEIKRVNFTGLAQDNDFSFYQDSHDPPPNYNIIHFRRDDKGVPKWINVGLYTDKGLTLQEGQMKFYTQGTAGGVPRSICSSACGRGQVKKVTEGDHCCWVCTKCPPFSYTVNETHCGNCEIGTLPNYSLTGCDDIPAEQVEWFSVYGIICSIISLFGAIVNFVILVILMKHNETPLVKASGRELSYIILMGLFICFAVTPIILLPPSVVSCSAFRVISGLGFVIVYAGILTKTNRIARIFRSGKRTTKRPGMISPRSQLILCLAVCSVQIVVLTWWLYSFPPNIKPFHPNRKTRIIACGEAVNGRFAMAYAWPICLCLFCVYYAIQVRKMPAAFNESRHIGTAVYLTCVIWLAFLAVYFMSIQQSTSLRVSSVCISTSLTAFVIQTSIFLPKVYIILLRPEKNVRQSLMTGGGGSRPSQQGKSLLYPNHSSGGGGGSGSGGMIGGNLKDPTDSSLFSDEEVVELTRRADGTISRLSNSIGTQTSGDLFNHNTGGCGTSTMVTTPGSPGEDTELMMSGGDDDEVLPDDVEL